jgi:hypothetical protein
MYFNDGSKYVGDFISGIPHKNEEEFQDENVSFKSCELKKRISTRYSVGLM